MRNAPLHESHLLEAVRRKIVSSDQMEQVLALARSMPAGGAVADVRWATAVQGLIAAAAVMGSGLGILADTSDHGVSLGTTAYSALGLGVFLGLAHFLGRYSWGRVPGAILRAGSSVWSFGVVLGLLSLAMPLQHYTGGYGPDYYAGYSAARASLDTAYALSGLAAALFALGLWRLWRCAPALGLAGVHVVVAATTLLTSPGTRAFHGSDAQALGVMAVGGALFAAAAALDRFARGPVDGAFWLYPVAMFPMGCAAVMRLDRHEGEVFLWLPLALGLGAVAYANGRRFPLILSAVATVFFPAFALSEARAPDWTVIAALVASAALVAAAVQFARARDLRAGAPAAEAPSLWG